jgi:hypothetical protein
MEKQSNLVLILIITGIGLILISLAVKTGITGLALQNDVLVSIKNVTTGEITLFDYARSLVIGDRQEIYVEFTNTGANPYASRIEIRVYYYSDGRLNETAYYYDSSVFLYPAMKRDYHAVFVPSTGGIYYIKVTVRYETKVIEAWGVFGVQEYATTTTTTTPAITTVTAIGGGGVSQIFATTVPPKYLGANPKLDAEYKENISIIRGDSDFIAIRVINKGDVKLNNIGLYFSVANFFEVNINPKVISTLEINESKLFLVSIKVPKDAVPGGYNLNFDITSDLVKKQGSILINVVAMNMTKEDLMNKITNYKFLIYEIEGEISSAFSRGFNASEANESLGKAKEELKIAEGYLDSGDYEKTYDSLTHIKGHIEDTLFLLANSMFYLYAAPPVDLSWLIILIIILIALLFIYLFYRRRKKAKAERPRMLKRMESEKEA